MVLEITDRQLEIIEAAGKILTKSGVGGLTIKNLAKEMKFSESAIYRHFESKEDIIVAMLEYLVESLDGIFDFSISEDESPEEKFKLIFQSQLTFFNENPHFAVAVFSDGLMEESERINKTILKLMTVIVKHLMPVIMEGQQKKVFTGIITTEEMMHIVMGTFRLQMFKWRIAGFKFDIVRNGDNMIQALLTLIKGIPAALEKEDS